MSCLGSYRPPKVSSANSSCHPASFRMLCIARLCRQRRDGFDRRSIKLLCAGWLPHVPLFDGAVLTLKTGVGSILPMAKKRGFPKWPPPPLPGRAGVSGSPPMGGDCVSTPEPARPCERSPRRAPRVRGPLPSARCCGACRVCADRACGGRAGFVPARPSHGSAPADVRAPADQIRLTRRVTIGPRRLDQDPADQTIARLGDLALSAPIAAGIFRPHQADVGHQMARRREAPEVADLRHHHGGLASGLRRATGATVPPHPIEAT